MTNEDFKIINEVLKNMKKEEIEELKSLLEVGIHWNVEVNDNSVMVSSLLWQMPLGNILRRVRSIPISINVPIFIGRNETILEPLGHYVSQVFCSAYPVGYNRVDINLTQPLSVIIQGTISIFCCKSHL